MKITGEHEIFIREMSRRLKKSEDDVLNDFIELGIGSYAMTSDINVKVRDAGFFLVRTAARNTVSTLLALKKG